MCQVPCSTCLAQNFYSCTACSSVDQTLENSLCITYPTMLIQIITTTFILIFIMPVIFRKRCVVLMKIFDFIQICAYFKLIKGYNAYRHIWLYLGMRSWGTWSQGWNIISGDQIVPIWTIEEGHIDKIIRIVAMWGLVFFIIFFVGLLKVMISDKPPSFCKFLRKNVTQSVYISLYITVIDMGFIIGALMKPSFSSAYEIVTFCLGCFFVILIIGLLLVGFNLINFQKKADKFHNYQHMFLLSYDYDLFLSYKLTNIPDIKKQHRFSNLRLISIISKCLYSMLIYYFLIEDKYNTYEQIFIVMSFIVLNEIVWFILIPMDLKQQYFQFIILCIGQVFMIGTLFAPYYIYQDIVLLIVILIPFGLALLSLFLQLFLDLYCIIPVDLYETGERISIKDTKLLKELQLRKLKEEQYQRKIEELENQNKKLAQPLKNTSRQKNRYQEESKRSKQQTVNHQYYQPKKSNGPINPHYSSEDLNESKIQELDDDILRQSDESEDMADQYRIDELKKRKVYQWEKRTKFVYSNKMDINQQL